MSFENPLDPVLTSLKITRASLNVAGRSKDDQLWEKAKYHIPSKSDFEESRRQIDDLYVIAMWAIFERRVIEALLATIEVRTEIGQEEFRKAIEDYLPGKVEFWRFEEILDLFKKRTGIKGEIIGTAKPIKMYRDWLVHRNPKKDPATSETQQILPDKAYIDLTAILEAIHYAT